MSLVNSYYAFSVARPLGTNRRRDLAVKTMKFSLGGGKSERARCHDSQKKECVGEEKKKSKLQGGTGLVRLGSGAFELHDGSLFLGVYNHSTLEIFDLVPQQRGH